jgi:hypothetical protein
MLLLLQTASTPKLTTHRRPSRTCTTHTTATATMGMGMETIKRAKVVEIIRVVLGMAIKKINRLIILEIPEVGANLL